MRRCRWMVSRLRAENDDPGPLSEWLVSGDVPLDDSGVLKVSQASCDPSGRTGTRSA